MAAARKRQELAAQQERLREAYNELKYTAPDKVAAMRDQEMTRLQMNLAYRTGELLLRPKLQRGVQASGVLSAHNSNLCVQGTVRRLSS